MAKISADRIRVAIDIGTTKICVIVAHKLNDDQIEILGVGKSPSHGLKKGVVVDIARSVRSIKVAVAEAELITGIPITKACIGISGGHISAVNSSGVAPIKNGAVTIEDIENTLAAAKALPIAEGQQILHALAQYFVIDGHDTVTEPLGMHGARLEVAAHIILGATASVQNLISCCELAGILVTDLILEQLASSCAVLSNDERELGVALLDIGGGTSDLAIYQQGSIRHTMVLPVAGNHFTHDIAVGLRVTIETAERIKQKWGIALRDLMTDDHLIEVEFAQGNTKGTVHQSALTAIIEPRAQELLHIVHEELIQKKLMPCIQAGLVLTGGGALLTGMLECAQRIFHVPVRIGTPRMTAPCASTLASPLYATSYGLLAFMLAEEKTAYGQHNRQTTVHKVFERMKSWVADFF